MKQVAEQDAERARFVVLKAEQVRGCSNSGCAGRAVFYAVCSARAGRNAGAGMSTWAERQINRLRS